MKWLIKASRDLGAFLEGEPGKEGGAVGPADLVNVPQVVVEPPARSDLLLQQLEGSPLTDLPDDLAVELIDSFVSGVTSPNLEIVVFSILPEVTSRVWRHRRRGYVVSPSDDRQRAWPSELRESFQEHFIETEPINPRKSFTNLVRFVNEVHEKSKATFVFFNCSSVDPEDEVHSYYGQAETLSMRVHRFNLMAMKLSQETGGSIVDVDRLIAELGARQNVLEPFRYSQPANRAIRAEFERILRDRGMVGSDTVPVVEQAQILRLPYFDRRIEAARIVQWHKREGDTIRYGDPLFDLKAEHLSWTIEKKQRFLPTRGRLNRVLTLRVVAAEDGILRRIDAAVGAFEKVGDPVGVVTRSADLPVEQISTVGAREFRSVATVHADG
jgi:hypothetical protein